MKFQDIFKRIKFNFFLRHKIKIEKYIFTIGAPRSGTTFLCQLLNSHPNILISNEDRTIDNILNKNINFDEAITNSNISAFEQFKNGYKINKKFQGKWNDINKKKILKKKNISIVGDKKSGQNAEIFNAKKDEFINVFVKPNIFFLQIVRDPINAAKSYEKSHSHEVFGFNDSLDKILKKNSYGFELGKILQKNYIKVYYEDLITKPVKTMKEIIEFIKFDLDERINKEWLNLIKENFNKEKNIDNNLKFDLLSTLNKNYKRDIIHYLRYLT